MKHTMNARLSPLTVAQIVVATAILCLALYQWIR